MAEKTNAMRVLDQRRIPYHIYEFSPEIHSADGVAEALGLPMAQVYKTLVVIPPSGKAMLVLVAANRQVDLKILARSVNVKNLRMAAHKEAEDLTGLQVGGISALALLTRPFQVYVDRTATEFPEFVVSAGKRGVNLRLRVDEFMKISRARWAEASDEDLLPED